MQVQIDKTTRQIVAYGAFPTPPTDPAILLVEITDAQAAKLTHAGDKILGANGQITVTPPDPNAPNPFANPKRAAAITALKTAAAGTGPMATVAQAILDLGGVG
jgi:hypothetical protein